MVAAPVATVTATAFKARLAADSSRASVRVSRWTSLSETPLAHAADPFRTSSCQAINCSGLGVTASEGKVCVMADKYLKLLYKYKYDFTVYQLNRQINMENSNT
jgi:hypothetical protein